MTDTDDLSPTAKLLKLYLLPLFTYVGTQATEHRVRLDFAVKAYAQAVYNPNRKNWDTLDGWNAATDKSVRRLSEKNVDEWQHMRDLCSYIQDKELWDAFDALTEKLGMPPRK